MEMDIQNLFGQLWQDYLKQCPSADQVHQLLGRGEAIINDHVAFRTFRAPGLGIDKLAQHFLALGYVQKGEYQFEQKKLYARHYEHPDSTQPKVFISELKLEECSEQLQQIVASLLAQLPEGLVDDVAHVYGGAPWKATQEQYRTLLAESEYAAWLAAFGFRANHFTVSVNHLSEFGTLESVNRALKEAGFELNGSGGEIKGSPEVLLEQSSTLADKVAVTFADGQMVIPACFYEFALRYPMADGELYSGFVAASADKIFESTNAR
ncbi:DUF1338 domain-containing protein [Ferrimonas sediminicola]|uniref:2-oxoadipate dioxygenase/decarboxylase n=1 Tax=Ferrimonas sediminicola TaxID=2569538 RepID=A0A4U1BC61_9GAMM|nr:DUF1338 domain-containing protein [Ferrimonas sediminicola]TKB48042.1 DUF1338 domain-containing protein [Ferrimonas sediminicola]